MMMVLELNMGGGIINVPAGDTILPINDINIWLSCARIGKTYTTISAVLADNSCLSKLISDKNAVDYMARSTLWINSICSNQTAMSYIGSNDYCASILLSDDSWCTAICESEYFESVLNKKIPVMTSNTTPSGEYFASSEGISYEAYKAFDSNSNTVWGSGDSEVNGSYIGYTFEYPIYVKKFRIYFWDGRLKNFKIQASNNNFKTCVDLVSGTVSETDKQIEGILNNDKSYASYRLFIIDIYSVGYTTVVKDIQFYGREIIHHF